MIFAPPNPVTIELTHCQPIVPPCVAISLVLPFVASCAGTSAGQAFNISHPRPTRRGEQRILPKHARSTSTICRSIHLAYRPPRSARPLRRRLLRRRLREDALDVRGHHGADCRG